MPGSPDGGTVGSAGPVRGGRVEQPGEAPEPEQPDAQPTTPLPPPTPPGDVVIDEAVDPPDDGIAGRGFLVAGILVLVTVVGVLAWMARPDDALDTAGRSEERFPAPTTVVPASTAPPATASRSVRRPRPRSRRSTPDVDPGRDADADPGPDARRPTASDPGRDVVPARLRRPAGAVVGRPHRRPVERLPRGRARRAARRGPSRRGGVRSGRRRLRDGSARSHRSPSADAGSATVVASPPPTSSAGMRRGTASA